MKSSQFPYPSVIERDSDYFLFPEATIVMNFIYIFPYHIFLFLPHFYIYNHRHRITLYISKYNVSCLMYRFTF